MPPDFQLPGSILLEMWANEPQASCLHFFLTHSTLGKRKGYVLSVLDVLKRVFSKTCRNNKIHVNIIWNIFLTSKISFIINYFSKLEWVKRTNIRDLGQDQSRHRWNSKDRTFALFYWRTGHSSTSWRAAAITHSTRPSPFHSFLICLIAYLFATFYLELVEQ